MDKSDPEPKETSSSEPALPPANETSKPDTDDAAEPKETSNSDPSDPLTANETSKSESAGAAQLKETSNSDTDAKNVKEALESDNTKLTTVKATDSNAHIISTDPYLFGEPVKYDPERPWKTRGSLYSYYDVYKGPSAGIMEGDPVYGVYSFVMSAVEVNVYDIKYKITQGDRVLYEKAKEYRCYSDKTERGFLLESLNDFRKIVMTDVRSINRIDGLSLMSFKSDIRFLIEDEVFGHQRILYFFTRRFLSNGDAIDSEKEMMYGLKQETCFDVRHVFEKYNKLTYECIEKLAEEY